MVRSAASTRRLIWCRVTESRATFLGTMTAYPLVSFDKIAEKWGEETRLPAERTLGNTVRESRYVRGNTEARR